MLIGERKWWKILLLPILTLLGILSGSIVERLVKVEAENKKRYLPVEIKKE